MRHLFTISAVLAHIALACLIGVVVSVAMMPDHPTVQHIVAKVCGVQRLAN